MPPPFDKSFDEDSWYRQTYGMSKAEYDKQRDNEAAERINQTASQGNPYGLPPAQSTFGSFFGQPKRGGRSRRSKRSKKSRRTRRR